MKNIEKLNRKISRLNKEMKIPNARGKKYIDNKDGHRAKHCQNIKHPVYYANVKRT